MTIMVHSNIRQLYATVMIQSYAAPASITIYSGTQPTAASVLASWSSYNSSNASFLVHYQSCTWEVPAGGTVVALTGFPAEATPTNSGTATWGIAWATAITLANMGTGTIPTTNFFIGTVTDAAGIGVFRFDSTTLSTSTPVGLYDVSFNVTS